MTHCTKSVADEGLSRGYSAVPDVEDTGKTLCT
jgi:hypothetical protein